MGTRIRTKRVHETADYAAMMRRMIAAHGRRVGDGNLEDFAELVALRDTLDAAINTAARHLYVDTADRPGYSWGQIGGILGITRQSARERFTRDAA